MDNGPSYEPEYLDLPDGLSYCVDCGNVMVHTRGRDCPACHVSEMVKELQRQTDIHD